MPQMFPLMWMILFFTINSLVVIMMTTMHFLSNKIPLEKLPSKTHSSYQPWKW